MRRRRVHRWPRDESAGAVRVTAPTASGRNSGYGTGRERLLGAAREEFAAKGFRGATTKDIAERAGVTEPMVFRHFGSKAALFEEAAVEPVVAFMDDYVTEWGTREQGSTDAVGQVSDFVSRLVAVLDIDRELLLAILAAGQFDETLIPAAERLRTAFGRIIGMFEGIVNTELTLRGLDEPDRAAYARVLLGIAISFALHGDWLTIGEQPREVSLQRLLNEAARMAIRGVYPDPAS